MVIKSQKQSCQSPMHLLVLGFQNDMGTMRSNALAFVFLSWLCTAIIHFSPFFFQERVISVVQIFTGVAIHSTFQTSRC